MIIPHSADYLLEHLEKYGQYSTLKGWKKWYAKVALFKGRRITKTLLSYKNNNSRLLDLGCGTGLALSIVGRVFHNSVGCDTEEKEVKAAKELLKKLNLDIPVIKYDGKKLPFKDGSFDVVISIDVIEHAKDPTLMMEEIRRVLKKNGILHITTANKLWPIEPHFRLPFLSYLPNFLADWYVKITGRGDSYQKIKLPTYCQFLKMVEQSFKVEDITLLTIKNYRKFDLDKERGLKVVILGNILQSVDKLKKFSLLKYLIKVFERCILNMSLGWLFIAYPKKLKS